MKIGDKIGAIIKETFSSPRKNSFVTSVEGKSVVLREGGNYKNINLRGANLTNAHLENIDLEGADLTGAILVGANLKGANLKKVKFDRAVMTGVDLTDAVTEVQEIKNTGSRSFGRAKSPKGRR